jgi:hypothetical protein
MKDPLLSIVQLKNLEEIIAAARETIHRHRRRFLQRNLRPCPENCQGASMVGHKVVGCTNCGSPNTDSCIKEDKFVPLFTKEELAQQFADQLRNPDVLLREYRDITVFLWVLGAFDKQSKTLDETIVEKVEQREKSKAVASGGGGSGSDVGVRNSGSNDSSTTSRIGRPTPDGNTKHSA